MLSQSSLTISSCQLGYTYSFGAKDISLLTYSWLAYTEKSPIPYLRSYLVVMLQWISPGLAEERFLKWQRESRHLVRTTWHNPGTQPLLLASGKPVCTGGVRTRKNGVFKKMFCTCVHLQAYRGGCGETGRRAHACSVCVRCHGRLVPAG